MNISIFIELLIKKYFFYSLASVVTFNVSSETSSIVGFAYGCGVFVIGVLYIILHFGFVILKKI